MSNVGDDRASFGQLLRLALLRLDRRSKQGVMGATDATLGGLCAIAAIWVTGAAPVFSTVSLAQIAMVGAAAALVAVPVNIYFGLYRSVVRFLGADLFVAGTKAAVSLTVIVFAVAAFATNFADPFRIAFAFCPLAAISICGSRLLARLFLNRRQLDPERVVIYGAGAGGVRLASALAAGEHYLPVAFVDDSRPLWGKVVGGLEVYPATQIKRVIDRIGASRVLLALPSVSRRRRRRILERLVDMPVHVQTMPDVADIVAGRARVDDIREVDVEDLLGRDAVPPNPALLNACISDKSVMVTGAGGSIGSELCRQMLALSPKVLVIFDQSEPALYDVCRQLTRLVSGNEKSCKIVPLLGSVCDRRRVREVMQAYGVQTVYHAAAYKHVPIVEQNLVDGVRNNALGTLHTAQAAIDADVETFVLISTDKAVSPTNVMGASKRFAELILQAIHRNNSQVRFCMVRFGNVLASSGSVVPLFREQIRAGGPVTVTHPEIIRYFMTIPEAAQLVIQAGSMARGGDVFVLDMGKPVKILELARRMVHLMGLTVRDEENPDGDIEIKFTGLRPAEKLYEELLIGSDVSGTEHPRILRANEAYLEPDRLNPLIADLRDTIGAGDAAGVRGILMRAVSGYQPTNGMSDLIWQTRSEEERAADNVTKLQDFRGT